MSFFDDFAKSASVVAKKAAKGVESATKGAVRKSSEFAEVSKLKMKITAEEKAVEDLYYTIGKKMYSDCVTEGIVPERIQEECTLVYEHKARIADLKGKIELVRGGNEFSQEEDSDVAFPGEEVVIEEVEEPMDAESLANEKDESTYADISSKVKEEKES